MSYGLLIFMFCLPATVTREVGLHPPFSYRKGGEYHSNQNFDLRHVIEPCRVCSENEDPTSTDCWVAPPKPKPTGHSSNSFNSPATVAGNSGFQIALGSQQYRQHTLTHIHTRVRTHTRVHTPLLHPLALPSVFPAVSPPLPVVTSFAHNIIPIPIRSWTRGIGGQSCWCWS